MGSQLLSAVFECHVEAQRNPATRRTYASRLRPILAHLGDLPADTLTASAITNLEARLAEDLGAVPARKAVTLARAALRRAGCQLTPEDTLTLVTAARRFGVGVESLRAMADSGLVRHLQRRAHGRGESITFSARQLEADIAALPRCHSPLCSRPGTGPSGYCGEHFGEGGRRAARRAEGEILGGERGWLNLDEAVAQAGCASETLRKALLGGEIPGAERVGRHWRIPDAPFRDWKNNLPLARVTGRRRSPGVRARDDASIATLHSRGESVGRIADRVGVSRPTVRETLDRLGLEREHRDHISRRLEADERAKRRTRTAELYEAGHSHRDIADLNHSSPSQVRRDLAAAGVVMRDPKRPAKYPAPQPRRCEHCGVEFTPRFPSFDAAGPRRFHRPRCEQDWRVEQRRRALAARGLLDTAAAAEALGVGEHQVIVYIKNGQLDAERVDRAPSDAASHRYARSVPRC
jgi:hypothetical protein